MSSLSEADRVGESNSSALRLLPRLRRILASQQLLAWIDQCAVSGMSFLTLALVGRFSDVSQVGLLAIGVSVVSLFLAAQESLVTHPYAIQLHEPIGSPEGHAFSSLALSMGLCLASAVLISAMGLLILRDSAFSPLVWSLALTMPLALAREFGRRFAFARLNIVNAVFIDLITVGANLLLLLLLVQSDALSAATAIQAQGAACALGALTWLITARRSLVVAWELVRPCLERSWAMGKWLLSSQLAIQVQGYASHWLSLVVLGTAATGLYAGALSIVGLANPLLYGIFNLMTPKSARAFRHEGASGARRQAVRDSVLLCSLMGAFCVFLLLFGQAALEVLLPGSPDTGNLPFVLGLAGLLGASGVPASMGLASASKAHAVALATGISLVASIGLVAVLMPVWGLMGAAIGSLIAGGIGSACRWMLFIRLVPTVTQAKPQNLSPPSEA